MERVKYRFTYDDTRNFLIIFGKHLKEVENLELIPSGFILKKPVAFNTNETNCYVDVIGIPFRNVYNRVRMYYHRVTLSEFYDKYKLRLGTVNRPLRVKFDSNEQRYVNSVKTKLSELLEIPKNRFIVELVDPYITPKAFRFKFVIPESEFQTKDEGLCLHNDREVIFYVDEQNFNIAGGYGRIDLKSYAKTLAVSNSSIPHNLTTSDDEYELSNINGLIPEMYIPELISVEEDIAGARNGEVTITPRAVKIIYKIHEDIFDNLSIKTDHPTDTSVEYRKDESSKEITIFIDLSRGYSNIVMNATSPVFTKPIIYKENIRKLLNFPENKNTRIITSRPINLKVGASVVMTAPEVSKIDKTTLVRKYESRPRELRYNTYEIKYPTSLDVKVHIYNYKILRCQSLARGLKVANNIIPSNFEVKTL